MRKYLLLFGLVFVSIQAFSQTNYGYGTVIGGQQTNEKSTSSNMLNNNEQGIRVVLIRSSGSGIGSIRGGVGGGVRTFDVPIDTDYFELIMFYANIDPRSIRKDEFQILRVASTGASSYLSKDIQRYWTTYNFEEQYNRGGPFDLIRAGDIIVIQGRGLFNRPIFDPLTDVTFLLTLPTVLLSVISLYNTFIK